MSLYELKIQNLRKMYSRRIIFSGVTIHFSKPGVYGIAGTNGSGKSTLVKIIAGLLIPSSGTITHILNGKNLPEDQSINLVGFSSPYLNFYEEFSALENMKMLTGIRGLVPDEDYLNKLFDHFHLADRKNDPVKAYSSGMKQRLRLIFAFFHNPRLVILDEPVSNLDNSGKEQIYRLVNQKQTESIILIASNDDSDLALCEQVTNIEEFKETQ